MLEPFKKHIEENFPEIGKNAFLLACSGGLDSTVLVHLCCALDLDFSIAHCNFQLRGTESDGDEAFVRELAKRTKKKYYVTHFDTIGYVNKNKVSVQMAARELRYRWFAEIMQENGINILVTAHHADDNLETFLINLSRGTGINGLTGIPAKTTTISRPLLHFSRDEIETYAKSKKLKWREDSSNNETKYLRNSIRQEIVPLLKKLHPSFLRNFDATQERLRQTAAIASNHTKKIRNRIFKKDDGAIKIEIKALQGLNPLKGYIYALFKVYGFTEWDNVTDLLSAKSGKAIYSKTHRLVKDRDFLLLSHIAEDSLETFTIDASQTSIDYPVRLIIQEADKMDETGKNVLYVDKETLKYPLTLRKWQKRRLFLSFRNARQKKIVEIL